MFIRRSFPIFPKTKMLLVSYPCPCCWSVHPLCIYTFAHLPKESVLLHIFPKNLYFCTTFQRIFTFAHLSKNVYFCRSFQRRILFKEDALQPVVVSAVQPPRARWSAPSWVAGIVILHILVAIIIESIIVNIVIEIIILIIINVIVKLSSAHIPCS